MTRTFAIAAIISLATITAAGAETLTGQIHDAALKACSAEASTSLPASHYAAITDACVARVSAAAFRKIDSDAAAKTRASTALLSGY